MARKRRKSGKKTYGTKAAAKRGKPKGVSLYKVKGGGWRRSKARRKSR